MPATLRSVSGEAQENSPSSSPAKPLGLAVDDLMIAVATSDIDGTAAAMTAPANWELLGSAGTTSTAFMKVWKKIATSGDVSATEFEFPDSASAHSAAAILAITQGTYDPAATLTPSFTAQPTASVSHVAPSVTGFNDGLLIVAALANTAGTARTYTSAPASMAEQIDVGPNPANGPYVQLGIFTQSLSADGATGTKTATCSGSEPYVTVSLVIPPLPVTASKTRFFMAS